MTEKVKIDLGTRGYDIHIGSGLLADLESYIPFTLQGKKIFIVTDENVQPYAMTLQAYMNQKNIRACDILTLPFGEATKSYDRLIQVHAWMLENKVDRNAIMFAVGGGVIGDLTGFAAATILRGVDFVQVPTTVLSQVDSSVGGKTGINTAHGKNLVGAFYQPVAVVADMDTLSTLPRREVLAGYAEIVKYGLIWDAPFFDWLEENGARVIDLQHDAIANAVKVSCEAKADVVQADERENGKRALLNLGHTFGHALEAAAGYDGSLLHGEAVSIGMVMAFDLSVRMGLCSAGDAARMRAHLVAIGLPVDASHITADIDDLIATMRKDKKALDDRMTFILVHGIGKAFVTQDVDEADVRAVIADSMAKGNNK